MSLIVVGSCLLEYIVNICEVKNPLNVLPGTDKLGCSSSRKQVMLNSLCGSDNTSLAQEQRGSARPALTL